MIHYSCDVCGAMLPDSYRRPDQVHRLKLAELCAVGDVCPRCANIAAKITPRQVLLETWQAEAKKEPAETRPVLREHDRRTLAGEKRAIMGQLRAWRDQNGLGSFDAVAKQAGTGITPELLQSILTDAPNLPIATWRQIGKALNKLTGQNTEPLKGGESA